jgi:hypothetical protein
LSSAERNCHLVQLKKTAGEVQLMKNKSSLLQLKKKRLSAYYAERIDGLVQGGKKPLLDQLK